MGRGGAAWPWLREARLPQAPPSNPGGWPCSRHPSAWCAVIPYPSSQQTPSPSQPILQMSKPRLRGVDFPRVGEGGQGSL